MEFDIIVFFSLIIAIHCTDSDKKVNLPTLHKCCFADEHIGRTGKEIKVCKSNNISDTPINFAQILHFDYEAGKTIYDLFNVVPGKFNKDEKFRQDSEKISRGLQYNAYLIQNGLLIFEIPNTYHRFIQIDSNNFCFDFFKNRIDVVKPAFWVTGTNFGIDKFEEQSYDFLTSALFVSCFFLFVVLIVYVLLPELRNLSGLILMAYMASQLAAFLLLGIIRIKQHSALACYWLTLATYFFFIASSCWMNAMSFDIWRKFRGFSNGRPILRRKQPFKYFIYYSIYAWTLPLAMTIMLAWINGKDMRDTPWFIKPHLLDVGCFIEGSVEGFLYLYIPMLILICCNWLFFLMTAFNIWHLSRDTSVLESAAATPDVYLKNRQRFLVYLKLSIVLGLNWILVPVFRYWFVTDAYNILIGIAVFIIFVCKRNIMKKLGKLLRTHCKSAPTHV